MFLNADFTRCVYVLLSPATNIFIHGNEEQGQLVNEMRYLWGQNQVLQDQLNMGSRGKHAHFLPNSLTGIYMHVDTLDS